MKRVLHIVEALNAAGIESFIMNTYRNIDRTKCQFDFFVTRKQNEYYDQEIKRLGGRKYHVDFAYIKWVPFRVLKESIALYHFLRKYPYEIVHIETVSPLRCFYLFAALCAGVQVRIYHSHFATVINESFLKKAVWFALKLFVDIWATDQWACSKTGAYCVFSKKAVDGGRVRIINNGIDTTRFLFSAEERKCTRIKYHAGEKIVVGCVGRLEKQKNQKFAIEIFALYKKRHPESVLWLIGTGSMEQELRELVAGKGLTDDVLFLGNQTEMQKLFFSMDVFLFPSLYEGLGIVGIEAQAAGTPTVCTDTLPEELNITSLLYRVSLDDDCERWVDQMERAVDNIYAHKDMRKLIQAAGYDIGSIAKEIEKFYLIK